MAVGRGWARVGGVPVLAHRAHGVLFELKIGAVLDACAQGGTPPTRALRVEDKEQTVARAVVARCAQWRIHRSASA